MTIRCRGAVCLLLTAAGCGTSVEIDGGEERSLDQNAEIVLAVADDVRIEGTVLRITLLSVANDSRCPTGVACVWEGDVEVRLGLAAGSGPSVLHTLHWNASVGTRQAVGGGYLVTLVDVEPPAREDVGIEQNAYRIRLRVEPEGPLLARVVSDPVAAEPRT